MTRSNVSQIVTRKPFKITRNHPQITRKHIRKMGPVMPPIPYIWVSQVSPKIWVLLLLPKLRVVSVVSWSSCKSATHPPASAMSHYQSSDVRDVASFSPSGDYPVTDGLTACASTTKEFAGSFKLLTTSHLTGRAFLTFYNAISQVTLCVPPCTPRQ